MRFTGDVGAALRNSTYAARMAELLIFHHAQGLTPGVRALGEARVLELLAAI